MAVASRGWAWTSKMAKIIDPILPILSLLGYWAIILGSFGGLGGRMEPQQIQIPTDVGMTMSDWSR